MTPSMCPHWYNHGLPHIWQPYAQAQTAPLPLPVSHTEGCEIVLEDGQRLIDGISSWWSACHGHNHPHLIAAAKAQLDRMPHVMFAGLAHAPAFTLAARLSSLTSQAGHPPLSRVFFGDSGSTAVEVALKMALQYWVNVGQPLKTRFACLEHAYHGDTFGAMGVSDPARGMHAPYRTNLVEAMSVPLPHTEEAQAACEKLFAEHADTLAALIVEPLVQGAGGMRFYGADTLQRLAALCKQHNVLLIADEIMTGFGRTGAMFACHEAEITPDILCIGKGLTGGMMTLAATLSQEHIYEAFLGHTREKALMHGATFMANPLACAVANASLDLFETEPRLAQVAEIEAHMLEALIPLTAHPAVVDVRVKGAIGVVQCDPERFDPFALRPKLWERGCWLRPYGDILYLTPPFTISSSELLQLTDAICAVVQTL
jgi:adenosylmethionine---8-amino-7-oxononanoate aminotransferase